MSVRRPSDFPFRQTIDGTEELYTQTGGVNYKFLIDDIRDYIFQSLDIWNYKEITFSSLDLQTIDLTPIQILDENDLASGEFFEINRFFIECEFKNTPTVEGDPIEIVYKPSIGSLFVPSESIFTIPTSFIESDQSTIIGGYFFSSTTSYFRMNNGLYLQSSSPSSGGDSEYKIKIYYKIT